MVAESFLRITVLLGTLKLFPWCHIFFVSNLSKTKVIADYENAYNCKQNFLSYHHITNHLKVETPSYLHQINLITEKFLFFYSLRAL